MIYKFNEMKALSDVCEEMTIKYLGKYNARKGPAFKRGTHPVDVIVEYNGTEYGLEVKRDAYSKKSHNVAFEEKALTSVAKYGGTHVIYYIDDTAEIFCFKLEGLLDELKNKKYKYIHCGNGKDNMNWIVPIKELKQLNNFIGQVDNQAWLAEYRELIK